MIPKAKIETLREGEELIVRARYWTPEWVRFVETIWWPLTLMSWAGLSIAAFRGLAAIDLAATANEAVFWGTIASASVFALSWAVNRMLVRIGDGYGLAPQRALAADRTARAWAYRVARPRRWQRHSIGRAGQCGSFPDRIDAAAMNSATPKVATAFIRSHIHIAMAGRSGCRSARGSSLWRRYLARRTPTRLSAACRRRISKSPGRGRARGDRHERARLPRNAAVRRRRILDRRLAFDAERLTGIST